MNTWTERPWLGFDTETTGVDATADRLVTAALVDWTGSSGSTENSHVTTWLADPGVPIPERASQIHGISTDYAREHGRPITEVLDQVAQTIVEHWMEQIPVVAFNAVFDITLLNCELKRHDLSSLEERMGGEIGPILDPLVLDRMYDRYRRGKRTLSDMVTVYDVALSPHAHTADADVLMTLQVLAALVAKYPQIAQTSLEDLQYQQAEGHRRWAENFEQFLRRKGRPDHISPAWPQL